MYSREQGLFSVAPEPVDTIEEKPQALTIKVDLSPAASSQTSPLSKPLEFNFFRYVELVAERDKYIANAKVAKSSIEANNDTNIALLYQSEIDLFRLKDDEPLGLWMEMHFKTPIKCFLVDKISILHLPNDSDHADALSIIPPAYFSSGSIRAIPIENRKTLFLELCRRYPNPLPINCTPTSPRP